jgi:hypothetical protein
LEEKIKNGIEKPILFISWPEYLMSMYVSDFSKVIRNYENVFDVYYCEDMERARDLIDTKSLPKEYP